MKKVIFGTLILISAVACEGTESTLDTETGIEKETVTEEELEGFEDMEAEVEILEKVLMNY